MALFGQNSIDGVYRPPTKAKPVTQPRRSSTSASRVAAAQRAADSPTGINNPTALIEAIRAADSPTGVIPGSVGVGGNRPIASPTGTFRGPGGGSGELTFTLPDSERIGGGTNGHDHSHGAETDVDIARGNALADAIAAIEAQFNFEKGGLEGQIGDLSNQYRIGAFNIDEMEEDERRRVIEEYIRRGIAESTLFLNADAEAISDAADARAQLAGEYGTIETTGERGTRAQEIQSAILLLEQQLQAAKAQAEAQSLAEKLDLESLLALIGTGIAGTSIGG